MRNSMIVCTLVSLFAVVACGKRGLESQDCVDYFAKVEACAAKAPKLKGDILRTTAATSKANFEKNSNAMAVQQSCKVMVETLKNDPDCK